MNIMLIIRGATVLVSAVDAMLLYNFIVVTTDSDLQFHFSCFKIKHQYTISWLTSS